MPLYVADYLADTRRLSLAEHGAYMLLIMEYWRNGGLPNDDRKLARIIGATPEEWSEIRDNIADFFDDGWKHSRIERELSDANEAYERRASAGRKGGLSKQCSSNASSNAKAMLKQSQPQPQSHISSNEDNKATPVIEILTECLTAETAKDLIAHRKAKKSPLTAGAAKALVKQFAAYGDAEGAAQAMMASGWTGFKAEWMQSSPRAGPQQRHEKMSAITRALLNLEKDNATETQASSNFKIVHEVPKLINFG